MKLIVARYGMLEDVLPQVSIQHYAGPPVLRGFLESLITGKTRSEALLTGTGLKAGVIVLLNGRNVDTLPGGLDSEVREGDHVTIGVQVEGG